MRIASFGEGAVLAVEQLRANRFRSTLTILGIVIGVASVMAMSAIISGVRTAILDEIEATGPRNFTVMRSDPNAVRVVNDGQEWLRNPPLRIDEAERIARLPGVRGAVPFVFARVDYATGNHRVPDQAVYGRGAGWQEVTTWKVTSGRDLLPSEVDAARPVILLSNQLAGLIFGVVSPVGRRVKVNRQEFEVIGTFETPQRPFSSRERQIAIVPYTSAAKYLDIDRDWVMIDVAPRSDVSREAAMEQVTVLLRTMRHLRPADPNNFDLVTTEESARSFEKTSAIFFLVMIALSSVSLMVGGVGVIAIMMISVTERTREIGIRKALGATRREILWQFLIESVTVTFVGAAMGMLIGGGGSMLTAALSPIPARVPLFGLLGALSMAVVGGVLFGLWPAWRAARMDPVEALRYE